MSTGEEFKHIKQRLVYEDHNIIIKAEPINEEDAPEIYPVMVKMEHQESKENDSHLQTKTDLNFQIQEKVLNTFAAGTSTITKHYTIITEQNDDTYIVPDIIEKHSQNFGVKVIQPNKSKENSMEIEEINLQALTRPDDGFMKSCNYYKFETQDVIQLETHLHKVHHASLEDTDQTDTRECILKCVHCNLFTTNKRQHLIAHITLNHKRNKYENEKQDTSKMNDLIQKKNIIPIRKTKRTCTKPLKYICGDCDEKFTSKFKRVVHIRTQHSIRALKYTCEDCDERFETKTTKQAHIQTHHQITIVPIDRTMFICNYCQKNFFEKSHLTEHIQSNKCGFITNNNSSNIDIYDYQIISDPTRRELVMIKDEGQLEGFECNRCPYKCVQKRHLKAYLDRIKAQKKKKEESKKYSCKYCSFASNSSVSLETHVLVQHKGKKPYYCKLCNCKYARVTGLVKHIKAHFDK